VLGKDKVTAGKYLLPVTNKTMLQHFWSYVGPRIMMLSHGYTLL